MSNVHYINLTHFFRSQNLQLIDVERRSEISMNHLDAEVQHCTNIFHNLFPTENETHHIWDNCLEVDRSFENQDEATLRQGTFLEDASELDMNEFPNASTTGDNKQWLIQRIILSVLSLNEVYLNNTKSEKKVALSVASLYIARNVLITRVFKMH